MESIQRTRKMIEMDDRGPLDLTRQIEDKDAEIKKLFHLPNDLQIRRDENGNVDQVMPVYYMKKGVREEYV